MKRSRVRAEDAWVALSWLCTDLGCAMLDCPTQIVEQYGKGWAARGLVVEHHGKTPGLTLFGYSVRWREGGAGGAWADGLWAIEGRSWRDLVERILATRTGLELLRLGLPWERRGKPQAKDPVDVHVSVRLQYERADLRDLSAGSYNLACAVTRNVEACQDDGLFWLRRGVDPAEPCARPVRTDVRVRRMGD